MKRLRPAFATTRDGQTKIQVHEDEQGKVPTLGALSVVAPGLVYLESNHSIAVDAGQRIGATLAGKVAVVELLIGMVAYDVQLKTVWAGKRNAQGVIVNDAGQRIAGPRIEVRERSIAIDWPESGSDIAPPKFTVRDAEDWKFDSLGLSGPDMDEDTVDVYGPGTVLLHRNDVTGTVIIQTVLSSASARDALQLALTDRFATEPRDFRTGRRVALQCYYERQVRITLADVPFSFGGLDPTGERTKGNEFELLCFLTVEIPDVILVSAPPRWETAPKPRMP